MGNFNLQDTLNLASKLTPMRVWNAAKVFASFQLSRFTGRPVQWGLPVSVAFEPTTSCNLRCPECPSGLRAFTRPTGMLENGFFRKTIDEIHRELLYLIFYFQGEPYLNPSFLDMVRYASDKGIYTATSTNAHYLNSETARKTVESGLDRLIVSIDGTTQETYQQYRVGGRLEKVIAGAKEIVDWKRRLGSRTPLIVFQFLVVRPNEHQIEEVRRLGREVGVDAVWLKTAQVYDYENDPNGLIPKNERYSRYRKGRDGKRTPKNRLLNHCWKLWHANVITWDGLVVPCCFDKDAQHRLGSLADRSFREVWTSGEYRRFRGVLMEGRKNIDICSNCSEGTRVWG
jgi:radical SAM protein with 4Fe4S-binding SPASM domain